MSRKDHCVRVDHLKDRNAVVCWYDPQAEMRAQRVLVKDDGRCSCRGCLTVPFREVEATARCRDEGRAG